MRISDWSSDVCSSDLPIRRFRPIRPVTAATFDGHPRAACVSLVGNPQPCRSVDAGRCSQRQRGARAQCTQQEDPEHDRSEEHTSELQSLMRISYAVFCLKKKKNKTKNIQEKTQ